MIGNSNNSNNAGVEQVIEDHRNAFTKKIFTPNKDEEIRLNMYDPAIWKGFPLFERVWFNLYIKCCCNSRFSFLVDELINNPCKIESRSSVTLDLINKIVILSVLRTGTLLIEPMIIHPFVQISFVNIKTCRYLQKINFDSPAVNIFEKNLIITKNILPSNYEYKESQLDFIPPMSTPPYDLRIKGESFAVWNEKFIINDDARNIYDTNTVIFFELLDFNISSGLGLNNIIKKIAWGYIKPVGRSQTFQGRFKIQLYKYKYTETVMMNEIRKSLNNFKRTPDVLFEFNWINKEKYQTFLEIELSTELRPSLQEMENSYAKEKFKNSVFTTEGEESYQDLIKLKEINKKFKHEEEHQESSRRKILLKRRKNISEDCILPDSLLFKFSTAKLGCLRHEFSPDGKYLAAACTELNSISTIKIFNVEEGMLKYHFKGHLSLIHSLTWCSDSQIFITSSSDSLVCLWQIPKVDENFTEYMEYMDNEKLFKLTGISHPSYVYATAEFPANSREILIFASACFDGLVRIYAVDLLYDGERYSFVKTTNIKQINISEEFALKDFTGNKNSLKTESINSEQAQLLNRTVLDHRHPNSLVFDRVGRLYIGDSLGTIHIWQVSLTTGKTFINKLKLIIHKELEGDNINRIFIEPNKQRLIVHSRDNCIRLIDINKDKPKVIIRYFGLKCNKTNIQSCVSPDGQFVLSGSEDGVPYLWSLISGISVSTLRYECMFFDSLSHVSWNSQYNMFAFSAFGNEHPLLVYVHEKKEKDMTELVDVDHKVKTNDDNTNVIPSTITMPRTTGGLPLSSTMLNPMQNNISDFTRELKLKTTF